MNCWKASFLFSLGLVVSSGCANAPRAGDVRVVKDQPQLFVDDALIASQAGLQRTLNQPRKEHAGERPLIAAPKGKTFIAYGSIVYDTRVKEYVMILMEFPGFKPLLTTSPDGLNWHAKKYEDFERVEFDLKLDGVPAEKKNRFNVDLFSFYYDQKDAVNPYKGWIWLANAGNEFEGIWYYRSHDGRKWERVKQVVQGFGDPGDTSCREMRLPDRTLYGPGDVTIFTHDPVSQKFVGIFKFFDPRKGIDNGSRSRAYLWLDRMDEPVDINRIHEIALLPALKDANGDTSDDEYYASTAWRYGSHWLGGLKIFHSKKDFPQSESGCAYFKLASSQDALRWAKVPFPSTGGLPEVFMPNGPQGGHDGANDGGYMTEFSGGPLVIHDEIVYYYCSSSWGKNAPKEQRLTGGGLFAAKLRLDGFVSVDAGTFTTRPLLLEGNDLTVNAVGPVRVEVLNDAGNVIGATDVREDAIRHPVSFNGRSLRAVSGSRVRLRFTVGAGGHLYAFRVS